MSNTTVHLRSAQVAASLIACLLAIIPCTFVVVGAENQSDDGGEAYHMANPCDANPCRHGSLCAQQMRDDGSTTFRCDCRRGLLGDTCEINIDDCKGTCLHGGSCRDLVDDFLCTCPYGYNGRHCEKPDFWTLQQWEGPKCEGVPWRCFRLRFGICIDTSFLDGKIPHRDHWYGRLDFNSTRGESGTYAVALCFGKGNTPSEGSPEHDQYVASMKAHHGDVVPSSWCECENRYDNIPKLGMNGLGPATKGKKKANAGLCHKLMTITASRIVNSTDFADENGTVTNLNCRDPNKAMASLLISRLVVITVFVVAWAS